MEIMNIGVLTLRLTTNYGGILQAYALQQILEKMGHNVIIINNCHERKLKIVKAPFIYIKRILKKISGKKIEIFEEKKHNKEYPILSKNVQCFIDKYINCINIEDKSKLKNDDYDVLIVGSDQVWRPKYNYTTLYENFLDFAVKWDVKRIAYAASFGTDIWEFNKKQTHKCKQLVSKFDAVSVRESMGVSLCKTYFDIDAVHVLDPTLLLPKSSYLEFAKHIDVKRDVLFYYILDESIEKLNFVRKVALEKKLHPFCVNANVNNKTLPLSMRIASSVEEWIAGFRDANFIITDSFHGCVFSIIFNKPFVAIGNRNRGMSRFTSLLSMFGLQKNLIFSVQEYDSFYSYEINPSSYDILVHKQDESMKFLKSYCC